jgi:hypothetical protein
MKRTTAALIIGSLFVATQAVAASTTAWPEGSNDEYDHLPTQSTYADTHAVDRTTRGGSAFPAGAWDLGYGMPLSNSYAGSHVSEASTPFATADSAAFPESADDPDYDLPARNTYADRHLGEVSNGQDQPASAE